MESHAEGIAKAEMSAVIVRACSLCGASRERDMPCGGCGNPIPPVVHDLGVQDAFYADPLKRLHWELIGRRQAVRRARQANKEIEDGDKGYVQGPRSDDGPDEGRDPHPA